MDQRLQLENAANYDAFAQHVAMSVWGCADSEQTVNAIMSRRVRFQSTLYCQDVASWCDHSRYGLYIRRGCPATCGECDSPTTTTTTTTTTTVDPVCKDRNGSCSYWAGKGYCSSSSIYYHWMQNNCCASCCADNADNDGSCPYWTRQAYCSPSSHYYRYMQKNCCSSCRK